MLYFVWVSAGDSQLHHDCSDKEANYVPQFQLGQWEGHILSSLPFYMLLLPLLLELIRSRVSSQATPALKDLAKVTQVQSSLFTLLLFFLTKTCLVQQLVICLDSRPFAVCNCV